MVLTIDLDIIMEPCIQLYNSHINGVFRSEIWANNKKNLDIDKHLSINKNHWDWIRQVINQAVKNDIPYIIYSDNHNSVLTGLNYIFEKDHKLLGQDLIINVDHHHDLGYRDIDVQFKHRNITCANWAYYLLKIGYTTSYYWIRNSNSEMPKFAQDFNFVTSILNEEINIEALLQNCNCIIFIGSSQWIPNQFDNYIMQLQTLLCNLFSTKTLFLTDTNISINPKILPLFNYYER